MTALLAGQQGVSADDRLFWEDFAVGQVMTFGQCKISREDILGFARHYDPQPFHIDEQAARLTMLKGLAASGWHVCTIFMRMLHDGLLSRCRFAGLYAIEEIKWRVPVRPGDQLSGRVVCLDTQPHSGRPGRGLCTFFCESISAHGHPVMSWRLQLEFARRDGAADNSTTPESEARSSTAPRLPGDHGIKFFEDACRGDEIMLGSYEFSPDKIVRFNETYTRQPIHPDATPGRLSASGWHVTAIWMKQLVRYYMREAQKSRAVGRPVPLLGPSLGIKRLQWHSPVYADDVLTFSCWVERKINAVSKPGWGLLVVGADALNANNQCVTSFFSQLFLERRSKT